MTIQTLPFATLIPAPYESNSAATALTVNMQTLMTFDGSADRLALITTVPKGGTLTGVEFRTGLVSTAGATFQIQIEGVDASGNPDGTAYQTNANGTVVVATSDDNVWKAVSINSGTGVTMTKGDPIAVVLTVSSGTPNTVIIAGAVNGMAFTYGTFPYLVQDTGGGSWARIAAGTNTWCLVFNYGGTYETLLGSTVVHSESAAAIGNGAERGLRFQVPWKMRVCGARIRLQNIAAGADFRVRLYDSDGTTILASARSSSVDWDGDWTVGTTADNYLDFVFPETPTLSAATTYYVGVHQTTANAVAISEATVSAAGHMNAFPCGSGFYGVNRATGTSGAWTEAQTTRPMVHLWVDGFDDGAGSGGGSNRVYGS